MGPKAGAVLILFVGWLALLIDPEERSDEPPPRPAVETVTTR